MKIVEYCTRLPDDMMVLRPLKSSRIVNDRVMGYMGRYILEQIETW
jgi:hypothetical protein